MQKPGNPSIPLILLRETSISPQKRRVCCKTQTNFARSGGERWNNPRKKKNQSQLIGSRGLHRFREIPFIGRACNRLMCPLCSPHQPAPSPEAVPVPLSLPALQVQLQPVSAAGSALLVLWGFVNVTPGLQNHRLQQCFSTLKKGSKVWKSSPCPTHAPASQPSARLVRLLFHFPPSGRFLPSFSRQRAPLPVEYQLLEHPWCCSLGPPVGPAVSSQPTHLWGTSLLPALVPHFTLSIGALIQGLDLLVLLFLLFLCLILQKGGHGSLVRKISCLPLVNSQDFIKCSSSRNSQTTYKRCYLPFRAGKSKAFLRLE